MIPKFSIQLLVENAIKHGFDSSHDNLTIILRFDKENQDIIISNNGKAMRSTQFGIGLNNLDQRLQLLCNGELSVQQTEQPTFKIHIGACHENTHR
jgi:LytS/YehU family sensor histidine kinase